MIAKICTTLKVGGQGRKRTAREVLADRPATGDDLEEPRWIDRRAHAGIDYACAADRRIVDGSIAGKLRLLPVETGIERGRIRVEYISY